MTQFAQKSFSVGADTRSEVPEPERQARWAGTFGNCCNRCVDLNWAQTPMRHVQCPKCQKYFCPEHLVEHAALTDSPCHQ